MARSIARSLTLSTKSMSPYSRLLPCRYQSHQPSDLADADSASSSSNTDPHIRKLEDAIHCIMVRRSAPDWLPFYPGASYWVPPPSTPSNGLAYLLHNLTDPLAHHDSSSLASPGAWPSPSYFIQGAAPHPTEIEATSNCNSQSEDEEG
ncbi:uncharacterized protein LOC129296281 [Prosopis cineraria]|uniref:uncharacterized protein LOC129288008 n=1 Tax=Prosopis cineraria TaxID=364024 RepID=UPI00240FE5D1|nr:uncharacterized protein LOC129288008 [Prosopis cineraria]XP_054790841.1 uncharacterized protein LOC129296281 [Prosopis cineraria]